MIEMMKMSNQDQLKMHSPNLVDTNIEKIAALFPNCVTEAQGENGELKKAIDFDLLKQELSQVIVEGEQERYRLDWVGKKESILTANAPIAKTLRPCKEESVNFDTTENLFIEGDNLEALKLLQENYLGKVKMIYIDPPYNTGNDFIYNDDFAESTEEFFEKSQQIDEEGHRLVSNTESNGRFHSDWLSMIYSRLKLAVNLLSDDGVIFISVDDNEVTNLTRACDDVFGERNSIAKMVVASNSSKNNSKQVSVTHEYILAYSKNKEKLDHWNVKKNFIDEYKKRANFLFENLSDIEEIRSELRALVKYPKFYEFDHYTYIDQKGIFRASDLTAPGSKSFFEIIHPITKLPCKTGTRGWAFSEKSLNSLLERDLILFGSDETVMPQLKNYLEDNIYSTPKSILFFDSQSSTKWMKANNLPFPFPKATALIQSLIEMVGPSDIILDFFAGSSTTAHAVMNMNAQDNGTRKFIMVQLPEETTEKSDAFKAGYKTIAAISKERIRRAGKKIIEDNTNEEGIRNLDIGFRVLKIDSTNMKDVYYTPDAYTQADILDLADHIKADRTSEDLLFQVMLDWGLELSLPIERKNVAGKEVFYVAGNSLVACFDDLTFDVVDEVAKDHPLRFVSAEKAIHLDHDKTNIKERFKQLSPDTEVKFL